MIPYFEFKDVLEQTIASGESSRRPEIPAWKIALRKCGYGRQRKLWKKRASQVACIESQPLTTSLMNHMTKKRISKKDGVHSQPLKPSLVKRLKTKTQRKDGK